MADSKYNFQQISSGILIPALVVVIGLIGYFLLLPKYQTVGDQQSLLKVQQEEAATNQAALTGLKNLVTELEEKREVLGQIDGVIPNSPEIPELLANFDFMAAQSGLLITSLQLTQALDLSTAAQGQAVEQFSRQEQLQSSTQNLGMIQVDLNMLGGYANLKNFLLNLEQNQRLMDIQELTFEEEDQESGLRGYNLKILTYYQLEN